MNDIVSESSKPPSTFDCIHCSRTFTKQRALQHHIMKMHGNKDDEFECDICGKSYKHQAQFVKHLKVAHPEVTGDPEKDDKKNPPSAFLCPHCPKSFNANAALETHIATVHVRSQDPNHASPTRLDNSTTTATTPIRCDMEEEDHITSPVASPSLQAVTVSSDVRLEYYTCIICSAMFSSTESLKRHSNLRHKDEPINAPQRNIARASKGKSSVSDGEIVKEGAGMKENNEENFNNPEDADVDQSNVSVEYT